VIRLPVCKTGVFEQARSDDWSVTSYSHHFWEVANGNGRYLHRFFLLRTLNFTIGRFAVEATRVLLRRRRRAMRASAEKKCRATQLPAMTTKATKIASPMDLPTFIEAYLAHAAGM
jgi:hypothetical protein